MNDQKEKFGDKIEIKTLDARAPGSAGEIAEAAFPSSHGIIARDKTGKVITVDGHAYGKEKVDEVVVAILKAG